MLNTPSLKKSNQPRKKKKKKKIPRVHHTRSHVTKCDSELSESFRLRFPHYHHNAAAAAADTHLGDVSGIMMPAGDWPVNTDGRRGKVREERHSFLLFTRKV